ncbi:MAG: methionyl-tRNA formyltransferase [Alphaproteobacteria bacterium]
MRIAFMGTPDFSVPAYGALRAAGHETVCVYTQPPRPAGRGQKERRSPVHERVAADGVEVRIPKTLRDEDAQGAFATLDLDAAVVVAYGLILPKPILDAPRLGCINIHASLLPRWRGAAPIQRALLAGDAETGVTIMQMDEGLDTGPELLREAIAITPETTAGDLHDALAALGGRLIVEALAGLEAGAITPVPQPESGETYAAKIERGEERIDWAQDAAEVERHIRGFAPWPGAWSELDGERVKVLAADVVDGSGAPGAVLDDRLTVACRAGALRLARVQRAGKSAMDADAFLRGTPVAEGARFQ